jgi:hypothetical protein
MSGGHQRAASEGKICGEGIAYGRNKGMPNLRRHPQTPTDTTDRLKMAMYESKLIEYEG